jgi:hypothetical protein
MSDAFGTHEFNRSIQNTIIYNESIVRYMSVITSDFRLKRSSAIEPEHKLQNM